MSLTASHFGWYVEIQCQVAVRGGSLNVGNWTFWTACDDNAPKPPKPNQYLVMGWARDKLDPILLILSACTESEELARRSQSFTEPSCDAVNSKYGRRPVGCHARRLTAREWAWNEASCCPNVAVEEDIWWGLAILLRELELLDWAESRDDAFHATMTPLDPATAMTEESSRSSTLMKRRRTNDG